MLRRLRALLALLVALALAPVGCVHRPRPTDHLFPAAFTPMGHRGAAGLAPENTMAAFHEAAELGVPFELDVRFAAGGDLIVFHDDDLQRLAGVPGRPDQRTLADLKQLDVSQRADVHHRRERIPTLDEVLQVFGGRVVINVEIKAGKGADPGPIADAVVAAIERRGLQDRVLITSFNPFVLEKVRARAPQVRRGQIYGTFADADLRWIEKVLLRNLAFNRRALPDLLSVEHTLVTARYLEKMHRRGYKVFAWTVNDEAEMRRLIDLGVDGIITDRPDLLLQVAGRLPAT